MAILRAGPGGLVKSLKPEGEHSWQLHFPTFKGTRIELDMLVLYPFLLTWQVMLLIFLKLLATQGISPNVIGNDAQPLGKGCIAPSRWIWSLEFGFLQAKQRMMC